MKILQVKVLLPLRLDKYLLEQFPALSIGKLNKALRENKIKLNGKKQPLSTRVCAGDEIRLFIPDQQLFPDTAADGPAFLQAKFPAKVVYEDEFLLLADKPAGLPVSDETQADTLINRVLLHLYNQKEYQSGCGYTPALCHRLDTGTSGLVIVAKTAAAEHVLTGLLRERSLQKEYLCVTFGRPEPARGILKAYLTKDAAKSRVNISLRPGPNSKEIETHYDTLAVSGRLALLKVELITGRTHQIRAHFASIGCPVLGDGKYGSNAANRELKFKYQALCAWKLTFPPLTAPELAGVGGRSFQVEKPWYCQQVLEGTLR